MHLIQQVSLCPSFSTIRAIALFKCRGGDNAHWISKNKMAATGDQWELCGTNFRENIAWEFRVIMGMMTGLLGCCSSSTLGSRANENVKTLATLRFWLHHSPCSLGCWTNNTLAARSLSPKNPLQTAGFLLIVFNEIRFCEQHYRKTNERICIIRKGWT